MVLKRVGGAGGNSLLASSRSLLPYLKSFKIVSRIEKTGAKDMCKRLAQKTGAQARRPR